MAQPTPYTQATDFSQQEAINASGRSTVNTASLDAEFAAIEQTLDQTLQNLGRIQRDDGRLGDLAVEVHTLSAEVLNLIGGGYQIRGLWVTGADYAVRDLVSNGAYTYITTTAHTAGAVFDETKFIQYGFTSGADAAQAAAAAQTSATTASAAASTATTKADSATASAAAAAASASSASSSAASAGASAGAAGTSATNAANSAAAAAASAAVLTTTPYTRTLLDDPDAVTARTTLGAFPTAGGTFTGAVTTAGFPGGMANATPTVKFEVMADGAGAAAMAFHRSGAYALLVGLDTDNKLKVGGWSMGAAAYEIAHAGNSIGMTQTRQGVTGSRAINTTYTNTTGRPIEVAVSITMGGGGTANIVVDGIAGPAATNGASAAFQHFLSAIVPPGSTYAISTNSTLTTMVELR